MPDPVPENERSKRVQLDRTLTFGREREREGRGHVEDDLSCADGSAARTAPDTHSAIIHTTAFPFRRAIANGSQILQLPAKLETGSVGDQHVRPATNLARSTAH